MSYLTKEATAAAGEPMKMCRMHLTMTKLDGTGNTGTIKNFLPLPYLQGCGSDILNDQIEVAATAVCMFSSSTDVACKSVIECDGDAKWLVSNCIYTMALCFFLLHCRQLTSNTMKLPLEYDRLHFWSH